VLKALTLRKGANDVANSFATSVASRSLTLKQAMCIASVMEFAGAMLVGSRVTDTIRTKVISTELFESDPSVLMLAMTCAIVGSATYLTIATRFTMPVSTTHSIMGGVIGVGIASAGTKGVNWSFKGVSQVFAAWGIAPAISAGFGAIIFLITKHGVMRRNNPVKKAFIMVPLYCESPSTFVIREATLTLHRSLPDQFLVDTAHLLEGRLSEN
jgi:sodium-dependent phosphate transporter